MLHTLSLLAQAPGINQFAYLAIYIIAAIVIATIVMLFLQWSGVAANIPPPVKTGFWAVVVGLFLIWLILTFVRMI